MDDGMGLIRFSFAHQKKKKRSSIDTENWMKGKKSEWEG